jgi:excisionase family DNA binding protein
VSVEGAIDEAIRRAVIEAFARPEARPAEFTRLRSYDDVADLLQVSRTTVEGFVRDGVLEARKVGRQVRISDDALQTFLESCPMVVQPRPRLVKRGAA